MAVSNSGMTLYTHNDSDSGWSGEDGTSTEVFWQGTGSQKWIVAKNGNETATLILSADMSAAKYFNFAILSTIAPFYNIISASLVSDGGTNNKTFKLADRSATDGLYRAIAGEFKYSTVTIEFDGGTHTSELGTYNKTNHTSMGINVDNSTSGNIRSVENHYIDAMYYGNGRTIAGSTTTDKVFTESDDLNISSDVLDCCTLEFKGKIFAQTDIIVNTTLGNSYGETIVFVVANNTSNAYTLDFIGTHDLQGTNLEAEDGATVKIDSSVATSFNMFGGTIKNASASIFKTGQTFEGVVITSSAEIDPNEAVMTNCTFTDTTEAVTGSLLINTVTDAANITKAIFNNYQSQYAVYVDASVTEITLNNWQFDNPTSLALYWTGTSGTLTVNTVNGTNITSAGCTAASGGTVNVVSAVNLTMIVKDVNGVVVGALAYIDENNTSPFIMNTTTNASGIASVTHSAGAIAGTTWRVRKYGYKPFIGTVDIGALDINLPITLIIDPQQT